MNKPTREQIEHRAIEKMLKMEYSDCDICKYKFKCEDISCIQGLTETMLEQAERELTETKLSAREKLELRLFLSRLQPATMHDYTHIEIKAKPVRHTRFYIANGDFYDSKAGILLCLQSLKYDKRFSIEDLLK